MNRSSVWKRRALVVVVAFIVGAAPCGMLGLRASEWLGLAPGARESGIYALIIEDADGTLRLTSPFLSTFNADRPVAGEIGMVMEVRAQAGPYFPARETHEWRTEHTINPTYADQLPTGNEAWRALLARFAREHNLAEGEVAPYLGRADGSESSMRWAGIIANGAILEIQLLALAAIGIVVVVWLRREAAALNQPSDE